MTLYDFGLAIPLEDIDERGPGPLVAGQRRGNTLGLQPASEATERGGEDVSHGAT
jgi:hypothetical protein